MHRGLKQRAKAIDKYIYMMDLQVVGVGGDESCAGWMGWKARVPCVNSSGALGTLNQLFGRLVHGVTGLEDQRVSSVRRRIATSSSSTTSCAIILRSDGVLVNRQFDGRVYIMYACVNVEGWYLGTLVRVRAWVMVGMRYRGAQGRFSDGERNIEAVSSVVRVLRGDCNCVVSPCD